jgi:hypothetical protein
MGLHSSNNNLSIWPGSNWSSQEVLNACALEWEEEQENIELVKNVFKWMKSLYTPWKLALSGVPTNIDSNALQNKMRAKLEEACLKWCQETSLNMG